MSNPTTTKRGAEALPEVAPLDKHNRTLLENVHPPDWVNPVPTGRYNMVVIGAGTAGLVTAAGAAGLGARVALIERKLLGGDCLNVGCVPSKALLRAARSYADARDCGAFGVKLGRAPTVNFPSIMERMRRLRAKISPHDSAERFQKLGVDVFFGNAEFVSSNVVEVDGQRLNFSRACIATGARASTLPIPGLREAGYLTNETVFSLTELPRRLAVIGAGPIGCELAQAFARFGSEVTLLEVMPQILIREDRDAAKRVEEALRHDGVDLHLGIEITGIKKRDDERVLCVVESQDSSRIEIRVDEILLTVGRAPNVEGLGLEKVHVDFDGKHGIKVNDRLQTTNPKIFAAGDISSQYKFTHFADAAARIVIQNALFFGRAKASALTVPWCTYTDPEIAHVGLYAHDAESRSTSIQTFMEDFADNDRAILDSDEQGFLKIHVKQGTDKILGATIVARHAGEMISEITLAMVGGLGLGTIARTIHPYPTQSEVIKRAADAYNRTRLTPRVKGLFRRLLKWRR
ncbi:MAG: mercuric reductase [Planctomycetota bacterium]